MKIHPAPHIPARVIEHLPRPWWQRLMSCVWWPWRSPMEVETVPFVRFGREVWLNSEVVEEIKNRTTYKKGRDDVL